MTSKTSHPVSDIALYEVLSILWRRRLILAVIPLISLVATWSFIQLNQKQYYESALKFSVKTELLMEVWANDFMGIKSQEHTVSPIPLLTDNIQSIFQDKGVLTKENNTKHIYQFSVQKKHKFEVDETLASISQILQAQKATARASYLSQIEKHSLNNDEGLGYTNDELLGVMNNRQIKALLTRILLLKKVLVSNKNLTKDHAFLYKLTRELKKYENNNNRLAFLAREFPVLIQELVSYSGVKGHKRDQAIAVKKRSLETKLAEALQKNRQDLFIQKTYRELLDKVFPTQAADVFVEDRLGSNNAQLPDQILNSDNNIGWLLNKYAEASIASYNSSKNVQKIKSLLYLIDNGYSSEDKIRITLALGKIRKSVEFIDRELNEIAFRNVPILIDKSVEIISEDPVVLVKKYDVFLTCWLVLICSFLLAVIISFLLEYILKYKDQILGR